MYAIGEIVLVVIGILIALQINNWNEWGKERTKEKAVLQSLIRTLQSNSDHLTSLIRFNLSNNQSVDIIMDV